MVESQIGSSCPGCGGLLEEKGMQEAAGYRKSAPEGKRFALGGLQEVLRSWLQGLSATRSGGSSQEPLGESVDHDGNDHALLARYSDAEGL